MAVPSRLWLGGMVSTCRDLNLITAVVRMVRRAAKSLGFLVGVDGLASYVTAFKKVFRDPVRTGKRGRPHLRAIPGLLLGQVIKHHSGRRLVSVARRVVLGTAQAIAAGLTATRYRHGDQRGLHRATQRHLPRHAEPSGASGPSVGSRCGGVGRRDVPGGLRLQLLLGTRQPPNDGCSRRAAQVARSNPSDGGGADGPSLDHARTAELPDPVAALGRTQTPRTSAEATSRTWGGILMITVPWGATTTVAGGAKTRGAAHRATFVNVYAYM
jgi:hypothetical protein